MTKYRKIATHILDSRGELTDQTVDIKIEESFLSGIRGKTRRVPFRIDSENLLED